MSCHFLPSLGNSIGNSSQSASAITTPSDRRDRQLNYKKAVVSSVHTIDCRCLYKILMKLEIPFRGTQMKSIRHRFIRLLFENSCRLSPDYEMIIGYIRDNLGRYISLHDSRQLVLYCSLFGSTQFFTSPTNEEILRVIKSCPLSVPPFVNFKRWSRDVKRLESHPMVGEVNRVSESGFQIFVIYCAC